MNNTIWTRFVTCFHLICSVAALSLVVYWLYKFSRNADLCIVDYKKYHYTESDVFPMLTICLKNPFSNERFMAHAPGINQTAYLRFLSGREFDHKMLNVKYENMLIDMNEYVENDWIAWRNGSTAYSYRYTRKMFTSSYPILYWRHFYNCYTLQVPNDKQIKQYYVILNASVFTFLNQPQNDDMIAGLHYPNNFLTSVKNIKYTWPKREYSDNFIMRFRVSGMEVMERRNKANRPCSDNWKQYDRSIFIDHIQRVGCKAPYHTFVQNPGLCSSKDLMKKVSWRMFNGGYNIVPPCRTMTKILYTYSESSSLGKSYSAKGRIWLGIVHSNDEYKEIIQTRYFI